MHTYPALTKKKRIYLIYLKKSRKYYCASYQTNQINLFPFLFLLLNYQ